MLVMLFRCCRDAVDAVVGHAVLAKAAKAVVTPSCEDDAATGRMLGQKGAPNTHDSKLPWCSTMTA